MHCSHIRQLSFCASHAAVQSRLRYSNCNSSVALFHPYQLVQDCVEPNGVISFILKFPQYFTLSNHLTLQDCVEPDGIVSTYDPALAEAANAALEAAAAALAARSPSRDYEVRTAPVPAPEPSRGGSGELQGG